MRKLDIEERVKDLEDRVEKLEKIVDTSGNNTLVDEDNETYYYDSEGNLRGYK